MTEPRLRGATIAILESRRSGELATLVEKLGGIPYSAPALREEQIDDPEEIAAFLDALVLRPPAFVIFQSGVGTTRLMDAVVRLGRTGEWHALMRGSVLVARGPKPVAALRAAGFPPQRTAATPYTTAQVADLFAEGELDGKMVAVVHHGERNEALVAHLAARGALVTEVHVYRWALPADTEPLRRLLRELATGVIDVLAVTSQAQVANLFEVARADGLAANLAEVLRRQVIVAAIGPVAAQALESYGVRVDLIADPPKTGALLAAIAKRLQAQPATVV
jgi:uroporphyrinogen-III synthase